MPGLGFQALILSQGGWMEQDGRKTFTPSMLYGVPDNTIQVTSGYF